MSTQAANTAVAQLQDAGVLQHVSVGRRNRVHEAREVFELLGSVEAAITAPPPVGIHGPRSALSPLESPAERIP